MRVEGLGVEGLGVEGLGFRVEGLGVEGLGFRVEGLGVEGLGFGASRFFEVLLATVRVYWRSHDHVCLAEP